MKKLITVCLIVVIATSFVSADLINGGFESGMAGWTKQFITHGSDFSYINELDTTTSYHYSGGSALWGKATVYGNSVGWPDDEWTQAYAWSASQNLSNVTSVQLHLTDFVSNTNPPSWGYGQEIFLIISDGTNSASVLLIDNHEHPYGTSLVEAGKYTTSIGSDGRSWYDFDVSFDTTGFGAEFSGVNISNAKVGIYWEAVSWYNASQTFWAGAAVDDIKLIPEPATIALLSLGVLSLIRRKKH